MHGTLSILKPHHSDHQYSVFPLHHIKFVYVLLLFFCAFTFIPGRSNRSAGGVSVSMRICIFLSINTLSNSNYFTSAKKCRCESCIISRWQKWNCLWQFFEKYIFPNIQLKGVLNRLPPFKNLFDHTNRFLMG